MYSTSLLNNRRRRRIGENKDDGGNGTGEEFWATLFVYSGFVFSLAVVGTIIFVILYYGLPQSGSINNSAEWSLSYLPNTPSGTYATAPGALIDLTPHNTQFVVNDTTNTFLIVNDPTRGLVLLRNDTNLASTSTIQVMKADGVTQEELTRAFTIGFWFLDLNTNTSTGQPPEYILGSAEASASGTSNSTFGVFISQSQTFEDQYGVGSGTNTIVAPVNVSSTIGYWSHYLFIVNDFYKVGKIYVNGSLVTSNNQGLASWTGGTLGTEIGGSAGQGTGCYCMLDRSEERRVGKRV